jgi:hypothetical protein
MAQVILDELWIHDAADLSQHLRLILDAEDERAGADVQARTYAGGRVRMVSGPARPRSLRLRLDKVARADVDQLRAWAGRLLLFRDPRGRKIWGFYDAVPITELLVDLADVDLDVTEVTHTEAV